MAYLRISYPPKWQLSVTVKLLLTTDEFWAFGRLTGANVKPWTVPCLSHGGRRREDGWLFIPQHNWWCQVSSPILRLKAQHPVYLWLPPMLVMGNKSYNLKLESVSAFLQNLSMMGLGAALKKILSAVLGLLYLLKQWIAIRIHLFVVYFSEKGKKSQDHSL